MNTPKPFSTFESDSIPYGISYREWTIRWWKWLISIPINMNPAIDRTGEFVTTFQNNSKVWFLAGTFGGPAIRSCIIPHGKSILLPIINYECSFIDEPSIGTEGELESRCRQEIDDIRDIHASLDDQIINLKGCRVVSKCFPIDIPPNNCLKVTSGKTTMASDGYWLFLEPLSLGHHKLSTYGSCFSGRIKIGCNFKLVIR